MHVENIYFSNLTQMAKSSIKIVFTDPNIHDDYNNLFIEFPSESFSLLLILAIYSIFSIAIASCPIKATCSGNCGDDLTGFYKEYEEGGYRYI